MIGVKKPSPLPMVRVFLFPCLPSLAASVLNLADTVLTIPSRYPPEPAPLTPPSRWRTATYDRGLTSRLTVVGWQARLGGRTQVLVKSCATRQRNFMRTLQPMMMRLDPWDLGQCQTMGRRQRGLEERMRGRGRSNVGRGRSSGIAR